MEFIIHNLAPMSLPVLAGLSQTGYRAVCSLGLVLMLVGAALLVYGLIGLLRPERAHSEVSTKSSARSGKVRIYAGSVLGNREKQQDSFLSSNNLPSSLARSSGILGVVCDGMGGLEGGETASRICTERMVNGFYRQGATEDICQRLQELILASDKEVSKLVTPDGRLLNCGTTVVAAAVKDGVLYWASAGDSRIYLIRSGSISQITRDHSFRLTLMEKVRQGQLMPEDVEKNPQKNALISFVGKGRELLVDTGRMEFDPSKGDMLILCSDGLYKALSDSEILATALSGTGDKTRLPELLLNTALANKRIRHDNITVMVII